MNLEIIEIRTNAKKIVHFSSAGIQEIKLNHRGDKANVEGLAYLDQYIAANQVEILNTHREGMWLIFVLQRT
ncbi:MAG: hypothetical protein JSV04_12165 [Candidatus Heimdallarchaeota archaeon]|nr:MAG: hypothetical protein JSV04_12165 [Candidatus Heimdallarchaeota archaeon]